MAPIKLTINNYFNLYAFNPCCRDLSRVSRVKAVAITVFASLFTAGAFPLVVFAYQKFSMRHVIRDNLLVKTLVKTHFIFQETIFGVKFIKTENFQDLITKLNQHFGKECIKNDALEIQVQLKKEGPFVRITSLDQIDPFEIKREAERKRIIQKASGQCDLLCSPLRDLPFLHFSEADPFG